MTQTQIIATIGPATNSSQKISELVEAGVNFFRLNFSHGTHLWHQKTIKTLKKIAPNIPIILDTKGPEMRTGDMPENIPVIIVEKNYILTIVLDEKQVDFLNSKNFKIFVNHLGLGKDVEKGDIISIDSGMIEVQVENISDDKTEIETRVLLGGEISSRRHVNLVKKDVSLPTVTKQDEQDIRFGLKNGIDIIALSFLRCPSGVEIVRNICKEESRNNIKIWGKIECQRGVNNLVSLSKVLDGIMVARGDLGVETTLEEVPYIQRKIISICKKERIFSIVATEMLESMTLKPRPTRAEVSDVALATWEGANALMLSGETANGKNPIKAVKIMKKIIYTAEKSGISI